jgi:hypothetical protein
VLTVMIMVHRTKPVVDVFSRVGHRLWYLIGFKINSIII